MLKSFKEALGLIESDRMKHAAPNVAPLVAFYSGIFTTPVTADRPAITYHESYWQIAATERVRQVLTESQPRLLAAIEATGLPWFVTGDEGELVIYVDAPGRYFTTARLDWFEYTALPSETEYQPEPTPEEVAADEAAKAKTVAGIRAWVPQVWTSGGYLPLASDGGAANVAHYLAVALSKPADGSLAAKAAAAGQSLGAASIRLRLAMQAPPCPDGWKPIAGPDAPTYPVKNWQHWDEDLEAKQAAYEVAEKEYATQYAAWVVAQQAQWPLAWADATLLLHTAQQ